MHGKLFEASALAIIIMKVHLSDHVGTYKSCNILYVQVITGWPCI